MVQLSICIVNWNTCKFLRDCISSIQEYPPSRTYEVIVVDNSSTDGSVEMVTSEFPTVKIIANAINAGYAAGNNQALKVASGGWLLLLNPDVRVLEGTLNNALTAAENLEDFGALGIKQIGADNEIQRSVRSFPNPEGVFWELIGLSKLFPQSRRFGAYRMTWFNYTGTIDVDQPMATFLLTTQFIYEQVGGMDERFPIFFNDVDWCYRIKKIGKRVYYSDQSAIIHYGGAGTSQVKRARMALESKKSFLEFYSKHYKATLSPIAYHAICFLVKLSMGSSIKKAEVQTLGKNHYHG